MKEIVIATKNRHKVEEISRLLKGVKVFSLADFPSVPDIAETGATFYENALIKAKVVHQLLGKPVLADDSGLCVNALNGAPGVYSARYAGEGSSQEKLITKLLRNLKGEKNRKAHFMTVMVYLDTKGRVKQSTGRVNGTIVDVPSGTNGFGYDPVFYYKPFKMTFAELSMEQKNKVSHRAAALVKIVKKIKL